MVYVAYYLSEPDGARWKFQFNPNLATDTQKLRYFIDRNFYLRILDYVLFRIIFNNLAVLN